MKSAPLRWLFSPSAGMFYCLVAANLHGNLEAPSGLPAVAALLATYLLSSSVSLWTLADAQRRQRVLPYDAGSFIFFTWPLFVPLYLFSTRGWRGLATLGLFLLLYVAAGIFSVVPWLLPGHR